MTRKRAIAGTVGLLSVTAVLGLAGASWRTSLPRPSETLGMSHLVESCGEGRWTPPAPLLTESGGSRRVARSPSIVADANDLYVLGNDVPFYDRPVNVGATLTAWRVGHGSIGAPASDLVFASPKAMLDATGRLHVLWAEPAEHEQTIPPNQLLLLRASSLWAASYDPAHGWSLPTRVHSGPVGWARAASAIDGARAGRESLVAVPEEGGGVLVLTLRKGEWTVTPVADRTQPAYVSVVDIGERRLLAVVAADATQPHDVNSIFLYSQKGPGAWRFERQLQRSGERPALEVALVNGAGGRVHLVWRQMVREDYLVIRHMQSDDGGVSWTEPTDLEPNGLIQNLRAAADHCGRLHVVYEDWSEGSAAVHIGHATWTSRWSQPQQLHPTYIAGDLALVPRTDGSLMLAFFGTTEDPANRSAWQMFYSELR